MTVGGRCNRIPGRCRRLVVMVAARATGATRCRAGLQRGRQGLGQRAGQGLAHDLLDGACAAAAFGGAAEATINLLRGARRIRRGGHGSTNVVVAQHVAGTNNHGREIARVIDAPWIFIRPGGIKRKSTNLQLFQTAATGTQKLKWNNSK